MTIAFIAETLPITETSAPPEPFQPADAPSGKILEDRFVAAINALADEADAHKSAAVLVDVLAWALARMTLRANGPWGAGDVMRCIGRYVCSPHDTREAGKQDQAVKDAGQAPH